MSLSGNTEKITELLSKINALPEAGSGGGSGGGVETCTVTLNATYGIGPGPAKLALLAYVKYVDGEIKTIYLNSDQTDDSQMVLDSVVCGSMLFCKCDGGVLSTAVGATRLYFNDRYEAIYSIDAGLGEMATITYEGI